MSVFTVAEAAALGAIQSILVRPRSIGGFVADVTIEEHHEDEVALTEIPIETGAAITDHAYKRPARLTIRAGWTNSSPQAVGNAIFGLISNGFLGNPNYVNQVYAQFLILQASLEPFQVITGKRIYVNMIARRVSVVTTEVYENALMMVVECQEIIRVTTQTVTLAPSDQLKNPAGNAPVNPTGQQQLTTAPNYNGSATP